MNIVGLWNVAKPRGNYAACSANQASNRRSRWQRGEIVTSDNKEQVGSMLVAVSMNIRIHRGVSTTDPSNVDDFISFLRRTYVDPLRQQATGHESSRDVHCITMGTQTLLVPRVVDKKF